MTGLLRFVATVVIGSSLALDASMLICTLAGLGPNWWAAMCTVFGIAGGPAGDRIVRGAEAAWKRFSNPSTRPGDAPTLLALFAMKAAPVHLVDLVMVLNPQPDAPSWLHPCRRWRVMTAWAVRFAELVAEAGRLADAGLVECTERARREPMSMYEITGLGRDVAARNAEVLMAAAAKEEA